MPPEEQKQRSPESEAQSFENNVPETPETKCTGKTSLVRGHATQHQLEESLQMAYIGAIAKLGNMLLRKPR